ncbi:DUF4329 domain-containing protein [Pseudomonas sp. HN11]|uniref:DUF4329 domain-containing protein n=1 Tax=Pseudomonas sp. HN11 TaxID=1344094 RepID=UPI001F473103|nr:DUF4329 domain-containing protein [Pseudomonas sp. HN11]UII72142.1 DUF4329 domain-containing protein [Pseudomonas sp. HN11]
MSLPPLRAVLATHTLFQAFYTVGPQGSLVRFVPNEKAPGLYTQLRERFREDAEPALPVESDPVESYVHSLMAAGQLSVVKTSAIWAGWMGPLNARWRAYAPDPAQGVPEPRMSPIFANVSAAMTFAHRLMLLKPTEWQTGFLLKHRDRTAFIVTEPIPTKGDAFDPRQVFSSDEEGGFDVPRDYILMGLYCLVNDQPAPATVKEPWLYERFISPGAMAHALVLSRGIGNPGFALYLSVFDGAQLCYVFSHSEAEEAFFYPGSDSAHPIDRGLQAAMEAGSLRPRTFITRLAAAGELSVLKTSTLWDVAAQIGQDWQPYTHYQKPPLSPAFVLADDAARYAHERIGSRREREYIGLILQRDDQRFVATEPMVNLTDRFDFSQVFIVERSGLPAVLYPGHVLHGVYCSRWRGDEVSNVWTGYEARVVTQMFMDVDIHKILLLGPGRGLAYLSGAADCLLSYQTHLEGQGSQLFERTQPASDGSRIQQELRDGTMMPSDVVTELVLSGELRVVEGNSIWGPPGKIESDWSPPYDTDVRNDPVLPQLGPTHTSAQAAVVDACARWRRRYGLESRGLGLVLKHRSRNEFVASHTVSGALLDRLVQACRFGATVLTQTFQVHAVYYSVRGLAAGLSGHAAWIARHFIAADDFYCALYDHQGRRRANGLETVPLYLSPLDGALLEYRTSEDPYRLFVDENGRVDARVLPAKLGFTLTQRSYVQEVALSGQLTVLTASECWDVSGSVGEDWTPFAQINRRQLGPAFITQDDAARYALARLGSKRDRIYGGLILRRIDGLFTVTEPLPMDVEDFAPAWIRFNALVSQAQFLAGSTAVARYHSRLTIEPPFALTETERAVYQNMFSSDFLGAVLSKNTFPARHTIGHEYLLCSDGALLCFTATGSALEESLAKKIAPSSRANVHPKDNELERAMRNGEVTPSEYVNRVARASDLRVVEGSELWGPGGRLKQWQANIKSDGVAVASMDKALSPVFVQLPDVLRYVHRRAATYKESTFGVILKSRKSAYYIASHPLVVQHETLALEHVLLDGLAPTGCEVLGLYVCPVGSAMDHVPRLKAPGKQGYLPVYQLHDDGAWLDAVPVQSGLSFGPLFSHPDDAARHQVHAFQDRELIGVIVRDTTDTGFIAAEPLVDDGIESAVAQRLFLYEDTLFAPSPPQPAYPAGFRLLAAHLFFKTMGHDKDDNDVDKQLRQHFVGRDELGFYRNLLWVNQVKEAMCYVSTRQGALLKYAPRFSAREASLFSGVVFGPPSFSPGEWLSRLASDGRVQVLDPDQYWTRRGVVHVAWKSVNGEEVPAWTIQPAVSGKDEL